jgi:hypothetical protein
MTGCLHLVPAPICGHGTCKNDSYGNYWCECDFGYTGLTDLVNHVGHDCAIHTDTLQVLWSFAAIIGFLCLILGAYKVRKHIHAQSNVHDDHHAHGGLHGGHTYHGPTGNKVVIVGGVNNGAASSNPLSNGPLAARTPKASAAAAVAGTTGGGGGIGSSGTGAAKAVLVVKSPPQGRPISHSGSSGTVSSRRGPATAGVAGTPTAAAVAIIAVNVNMNNPNDNGTTVRSASDNLQFPQVQSPANQTSSGLVMATSPLNAAMTSPSGGTVTVREGIYVVKVATATATSSPPTVVGTLGLTKPSLPPHVVITPSHASVVAGAVAAPATPIGGGGGEGKETIVHNNTVNGGLTVGEDAAAVAEVAAMSSTAVLLAVPTARNYRAWIARSSRVLAFRLSLLLSFQVSNVWTYIAL